jgi:hypothetical protein
MGSVSRKVKKQEKDLHNRWYVGQYQTTTFPVSVHGNTLYFFQIITNKI